jgi:hypothetical protein
VSGNLSGRRRLGRYLPWPLVGVAIVLGVLIVLTPVLLSLGGPPAAGSVFTQAELIVDRVPGGNTTHFYVRAIGATVRYAAIEVSWASGFSWTGTGTPDWAGLNWTIATNVTDFLSVTVSSAANPIALNVSAYYDSNGIALYVGVFAFYVTNASGSPADSLLGVTPTPGVALATATAIASLPILVPLADVGAGRGP